MCKLLLTLNQNPPIASQSKETILVTCSDWFEILSPEFSALLFTIDSSN